MEFIIINICPLQNDALENYVRQTFHSSNIRVVYSLNSAVELFSEQHFDGLVLSTSVMAENTSISAKFRDHYFNQGSKVSIVLLDNADYCHIAQLLFLKPAAFVDKRDAKHYFASESCLPPICGYYISPGVEAVIGNVPDRFHPLWQLNSLQLEILSYILQNQPSKVIAGILKKSPTTIEDYRKKIKDKILITGGKLSLKTHLRKYLYWVVTHAKQRLPR